MKSIWKRLLAITCALILLFGCVAVYGFAEDEEAETAPVYTQLKFNDGKFKIIQIADLQEAWITSSLTKEFLVDLAEKENPDLFVLTGDNIADGAANLGLQGLSRPIVNASIDAFMDVFDEIGVPVTAVFGNHDSESTGVSRFAQLQRYEDHSSFVKFPHTKADNNTTGTHYGTHNLTIKDSAGETDAYVLWLFDSGAYAIDTGYDCVQTPQINWFNTQRAALGNLPSIAFQHIVPIEVFDYLEEVTVVDGEPAPAGTISKNILKAEYNTVVSYTTEKDHIIRQPVFDESGEKVPVMVEAKDDEGNIIYNEDGTVKMIKKTDSSLTGQDKTVYQYTDGYVGTTKYYKLPADTVGVMNEAPCPGWYNYGQFTALKNAGVSALFFGHDHVNTYELKTSGGPDLVNSPATGFGSYGDENRGYRVIELDESDLTTYDTHVVTYKKFYEEQGGLLGSINGLRFSMFNSLGTAATIFDYLVFKGLVWIIRALGI
ncbi:MAG: metallophosphoesterase [Oscillospiraceae bacterium]|nr:metallophosphoesterase [Oscillospiraceae bacterium]